MYSCLCECLSHVCGCQKRQEGIRSPRAGVTGGCTPGMDVGDQTLVTCKNRKHLLNAELPLQP